MHTPYEIGEHTEQRFFHAIWNDKKAKPWWFVQLQRASPLFDLRGIDALALVRYPELDTPVRIPVQIKSSELWRKEYFARHPEALAARVVVLSIPLYMSEDMICRTLYRSLGEVWRDRVLYKDFLLKHLTRPVEGRGVEIVEEIRERRRKASVS